MKTLLPVPAAPPCMARALARFLTRSALLQTSLVIFAAMGFVSPSNSGAVTEEWIQRYNTARYGAADGALLWEQRYNGPANSYDAASAVALDGGGNVIGRCAAPGTTLQWPGRQRRPGERRGGR